MLHCLRRRPTKKGLTPAEVVVTAEVVPPEVDVVEAAAEDEEAMP